MVGDNDKRNIETIIGSEKVKITGGFTYLIEYFKNRNTKKLVLSPNELGYCLKCGVEDESHNFSLFIRTYTEYIERVRPDLTANDKIHRALENIATFSVLADHDYDKEIFPNAPAHPGRELTHYLYDSKSYGIVTKAFSEILGMSGEELVKFTVDYVSNN